MELDKIQKKDCYDPVLPYHKLSFLNARKTRKNPS